MKRKTPVNIKRLALHVGLYGMFLAFSSWLMFHTFSYDPDTYSMKIAYKLWSDFGAHIPLIRSFSLGDNFTNFFRGAIQYPIFPGEPIRYHFLFYLFVGFLEKIGVRIDWALNVPSIAGFFFLLILLYILARRLFASRAVGLLTIVFFLFNGSLGFVRFFTLHPIGARTIQDITRARDFPAFAPWGPGEVAAFWNLNIYTNQRHLAVAFSLVILFILTVLGMEKRSRYRQIPWIILWGIVFGLLPYFHQPTLLIVAIVMAVYMLFFPHARPFLFFTGLLTTIIALPQLWLGRAGATGFEWYPGYIIHNQLVTEGFVRALVHFMSFWWQNLGLHAILIPLGFFFIPKRARTALLPIVPLFIIPNLFKFSVEASANHKFFNFILMLGNMISAYILVSVFSAIKRLSRHWIIGLPARHRFAQAIAGGFAYSLISLLLIPLTLSGIIDFFVIVNDTRGTLTDIPKNETATWVMQHTPKNAIFLNSSYLYHPASVAGRPIFLGWPYFAWSAGYKENRMPVMKEMYEDAGVRCSLLAKYHISYVTVEEVKNDPNLPRIDLAGFKKMYTPIFLSVNKKYAIFTTEELCKTK